MIGEPEFESIEDAQRILGLVMRFYNGITTDLGRFAPPNADDDDVIALWTAGYLEVARVDRTWKEVDENVAVFLFPMAVLASEVDLVGEDNSAGKITTGPTGR